MTKKQVYESGDQLSVPVPVGTLSGDPVVYGQVPGVALKDRDATTGEATVKFSGVHMITVQGINAGGNTAIAAGATVFFGAADNPKVSARVAGIPFGTAMQAVVSGATSEIPVRVGPARLA